MTTTPAKLPRAFSLLELLIVLVVLGVVLYFAFPNIVQIRSDSEANLARARAEMLNLAAAAYFQAVGDRATARAMSSCAGLTANWASDWLSGPAAEKAQSTACSSAPGSRSTSTPRRGAMSRSVTQPPRRLAGFGE